MAELTANQFSVSQINRQALEQALAQFRQQHPGVLQQAHQYMFSDAAINITQGQLSQMRAVIQAVEDVVQLPAWQAKVLPDAGRDVRPSNLGVFFGYDFHLNADGAHLIEINTNAGGGFLSALFEQSQQQENLPGMRAGDADARQAFVAMFRQEFYFQRGQAPLHCIAIVDENPAGQYFHPEFVLARQWLEEAGIKCVVADPAELALREDGLYAGEVKIDLVYNRLTDFSLQKFPHLLNAYRQNLCVLTPHPFAYDLYADKRNLALLTDTDFLHHIGLDEGQIAVLRQGVPETRLVKKIDEQQWWAERKEWFFKPATGFGGRGSYRGDKLTKRVFDEIVQDGDYVAQRKAMPGEVMMRVGDADQAAFKFDVRCYAYEGQVQLLIARIYQGQTTNFRTPGGGFGLVRVHPA